MKTIEFKKMILLGFIALCSVVTYVGAEGNTIQEQSISEVELLSGLDKEGRYQYHALNAEAKQFARELATQAKNQSTGFGRQTIGPITAYKISVERATDYMGDQTTQNQNFRLQNGMGDRVSIESRDY